MPKITVDDALLAWVSLVHAGTYLPMALSAHLESKLGVSLSEQDLLSQLAKAGGEIRMVDLARRVFLSKAGVTKMVDRLETEGLLRRVRSTTDRRVTSAELTAKGRALVQRSRKVVVAWVGTNFRAHLSDRELTGLGRALRSLIDGHGRWEGQLDHLDPRRRPAG